MCKRFYFTTDSLNALTAERLAEQKGIALEVVDPRDLPRIVRESSELVLDWDFSPEDERQFLLGSPTVNVIGIHGFNLGEAMVCFLMRRGLVCRSRLDECFFDALDDNARAA